VLLVVNRKFSNRIYVLEPELYSIIQFFRDIFRLLFLFAA
jgi:hypothetical protein